MRVCRTVRLLLLAAVVPMVGCSATSNKGASDGSFWSRMWNRSPDASATAATGNLPGAPIPEQGDPLPGEELEWYDHINPKRIGNNMKSLVGLGPDRAIAEKAYKEGEDLFRQAKYNQAAKKFKTSAGRWPDSALEEDALFMQAESYFFADRYGAASDTYARVTKKFENSRHLDTISQRHFSIAQYWHEWHLAEPHWPITPNFTDKTRPWFDDNGNAVAAFESVHLNDPTGPLADDAIMATANAHFLADRYEDADYYYDLLRRDYPKSEHQAKAHVLGLRSKIQSYQGPVYDHTPLKEAGDLIDQTLVQFPEQSKEERERLLLARQAVKAQEAQRVWEMGEFYRRKKEHRAARFYYNRVVDDYADTRFAELAKTSLNEIEGLPDKPKNYFKWLTKAFDATNFQR
ncbi:MAG: outer membrane protein assembly factor BamD [Pirellulales bacterium]|nr:outer membrane protein assembly factor BamD [Pirellulales bacterium]